MLTLKHVSNLLSDDPGAAYSGDWAIHRPSSEAAGFRGGSLTYRSCDGPKRASCNLIGYEKLHFRTHGIVYSHSFLGISKGHATMQYRQPIHLSKRYDTGPSGVLISAPTGQAAAHAGSLQCRHCSLTNLHSGLPAPSASLNLMLV